MRQLGISANYNQNYSRCKGKHQNFYFLCFHDEHSRECPWPVFYIIIIISYYEYMELVIFYKYYLLLKELIGKDFKVLTMCIFEIIANK